MKTLKKIELFTFTNKFSTIGDKKSLILKFTSNDHSISYSEASPLKKRSQESFEEAKRDLFTLCKNLLSNQAHKFNLAPSIMFAMTTGLLQLQTKPKLINFKKRDLLVTSKTNPDLNDFSDLIKVKIKGLNITKAIDLCKYLIKQKKKICVDCNGAFTLKDMLFFAKHFHPSEIQYLEEPCLIYSDLVTFTQTSNLAIAIDESLYMQPIERLKALKNLKLFVLKPTLIGGAHELKSIIEKCSPIACTLSSCYESCIGITNIIALADTLKINQPLGIDTCRYSQNPIFDQNKDLFSNRFDFSKIKVTTDRLCPLILQ